MANTCNSVTNCTSSTVNLGILVSQCNQSVLTHLQLCKDVWTDARRWRYLSSYRRPFSEITPLQFTDHEATFFNKMFYTVQTFLAWWWLRPPLLHWALIPSRFVTSSQARWVQTCKVQQLSRKLQTEGWKCCFLEILGSQAAWLSLLPQH